MLVVGVDPGRMSGMVVVRLKRVLQNPTVNGLLPLQILDYRVVRWTRLPDLVSDLPIPSQFDLACIEKPAGRYPSWTTAQTLFMAYGALLCRLESLGPVAEVNQTQVKRAFLVPRLPPHSSVKLRKTYVEEAVQNWARRGGMDELPWLQENQATRYTLNDALAIAVTGALLSCGE